jgi:DNA phosphorothioation-associated putative methyltransferase
MNISADFDKYRQMVGALRVGKVLPDAVYIHESALRSCTTPVQDFVTEISRELPEGVTWNVLKVSRRDCKVSFLHYPGFFEEDFPELNWALSLDLVRGKVRPLDYTSSDNPPLLHRKELLLSPDDPHRTKFEAITQRAEDAGLYEETKKIGFRKQWTRVLSQNGFAIRDGRLVETAKVHIGDGLGTINSIERHRTAIDRDTLSAPMQFLARAGYLNGEFSVFDFGCGKGHDVLELEAHGIDATGWDPVHLPDGERRPADVVNLGFVINVIEDHEERQRVLREAFALANRLLVVSVMLGGPATTSRFRPYRDGVVTSRNTFQKYYTQAELKQFVESTIKRESVAVAPGIFCVFKNELEEQVFLVRRQRVERRWRQLTQRDKVSNEDSQALVDRHEDLFRDFWACCLDFGRVPANDEFDRSDELRRASGSHRKAFLACSEVFSEDEFEEARNGRIEDLTVFLALSFFERRRSYSRMPRSLQRDIKAFFGKPSTAYEFSKLALFSVADTEKITNVCLEARERLNCGRLEEDHSFVVPTPMLGRLPGLLRIYVGCALQLFGDADGVDLIKIHMTSGKVSLMTYDDFRKPMPLLKTRVKVRLRDQEIDWFFYDQDHPPQPLYLKSQYLLESDPNRDAQITFDRTIASLPGIDLADYGPSLAELDELLAARNLTLSQLEQSYFDACRNTETAGE